MEVLFPTDDATCSICFEHVGIDDGIIIHLGEAGRRAVRQTSSAKGISSLVLVRMIGKWLSKPSKLSENRTEMARAYCHGYH